MKIATNSNKKGFIMENWSLDDNLDDLMVSEDFDWYSIEEDMS